MTPRRKSTAAASEPKRRTKGPAKFAPRMLPKIRTLLGVGVDEHGIAAYLGIETETLLIWAHENQALQDALDAREELRRWDHERNVELAHQLAARGATEAEIAQAFNVTPRTLARWRRKYPDFDEALEMGAQTQMRVAERTLFQMATGFVYEEEKTVVVKGNVLKVREQKMHLPSESSLKLLLLSMAPEKYSGKAIGEKDDPVKELAEELTRRGVQGIKPVEKDAG